MNITTSSHSLVDLQADLLAIAVTDDTMEAVLAEVDAAYGGELLSEAHARLRNCRIRMRLVDGAAQCGEEPLEQRRLGSGLDANAKQIHDAHVEAHVSERKMAAAAMRMEGISSRKLSRRAWAARTSGGSSTMASAAMASACSVAVTLPKISC